MDIFLGIDIGATNSKAVLLGGQGMIICTWKQAMPYLRKKGTFLF